MKGSICVDGTSLTVNQVDGASFELTIIPQTWEETVFSEYQTGSPVNLEVDVIARYLERLMQYDQSRRSHDAVTEYADIDKLLSELRHGHSCLLLNENSAGGMTALSW
jgi:hypothetical protein